MADDFKHTESIEPQAGLTTFLTNGTLKLGNREVISYYYVAAESIENQEFNYQNKIFIRLNAKRKPLRE